MGRVAGPFHQRDGEGARRDRVGNRASRDHSEEGAGDDGGLRRSSPRPASQREGDVGEELAGARLPEQSAVEDEQENELADTPIGTPKIPSVESER